MANPGAQSQSLTTLGEAHTGHHCTLGTKPVAASWGLPGASWCWVPESLMPCGLRANNYGGGASLVDMQGESFPPLEGTPGLLPHCGKTQWPQRYGFSGHHAWTWGCTTSVKSVAPHLWVDPLQRDRNTWEGINSRLEYAEVQIINMEDRVMESM